MEITENIQIPETELHFTFARSGGPGGQNVNKVASKAVLHWDVAANQTLPADVKARLVEQNRGRLTTEGVLVLTSQASRDQGANIADCLEKVRAMVLRATHVPKKRRKTKPSRSSKERRLKAKRLQSQQKLRRRKPAGDD